MWQAWIQKWRNLRLPLKLLLVYMPLILLPSIAGIYMLTQSSVQSSRDITEEYAADLLGLMALKINDRIEEYEQFSKRIMTDESLHELLRANPRTDFERLRNQTKISQQLNMMWLGDEENRYVTAIRIAAGDEIYSYGSRLQEDYGVRDAEYKELLRRESGAAVWTGPMSFEEGGRTVDAFRLGRVIRDAGLRELGTLTLIVEAQAFSSIFAETEFHDRVRLQLIDGEGRVLIDNGVRFEPGDASLRTQYSTSIAEGWTLAATMSMAPLHEPIYRVVRLASVIVLACIGLGLAVTRVIAVDMVIPIRKLMANMRQGIKGAKPNELQRFRGAVEIVEMNDTFISVMYEIEQLIRQVVKEQQRKNEAAMRVLQNQLSPHFLYNTLNSLRWMAILQKQDHMKEMIDSLNRLLAYSFRGMGRPVALREELAALADYAKIQKVRYRDFSLVIELDEELKAASVLKFMLQPLIENALIHGIANAEHGIIRITGRRIGDEMEIVVRDNGQGMPLEKLAAIKDRLRRSAGSDGSVGLANVHERLQLHYGEKYGLTIESAPGAGTSVRLRLPCMAHEGGTDE